MSRAGEIEREQQVLTRLYDRLDVLRAAARGRLTEVRRQGGGGTPQNRSERDAFAALYEDRVSALDAVEAGLCFGRLDNSGGEQLHIGRIGLSDDAHESMLVDWRAPAAAAFYRATAAEPMGVLRRRSLRTRGRTVLDVEDDVFNVDDLSESDRETLGGGGALLAAVTSKRTGRMRDIVATIQAEQDRIIRDDPGGVLVVQGGPGTGKTAVALHRAAYLLYNDRERLARTGVLVVGPGAVFLRYIEQVLPALGETGVVTTTLTGLLGEALRDVAVEDDGVANIKADVRWVQLIERAVAGFQRVPDKEIIVHFEEHELVLTPSDVARARSRARRNRNRHNRTRYAFAKQLLRFLVGRLAEIDPELAAQNYTVRLLMGSDEFREAVNGLWPLVRPTELVAQLLSDGSMLARVADGLLSPSEQRLVLRADGSAWTDADVPLLDEAWSQLGDRDQMLREAEARRRGQADREYARDVIRETGLAGRVDADTLAERWADPGGRAGSIADRAAADPDWEFGHVIVDEAQELSPMAWRMVSRRCPNRSMTVVGDIAQASASWAARGWAQNMDLIAPRRWRQRELTVNYRTPSEVMQVAAAVLAAVDPELDPPSSVRSVGEAPAVVAVADPDSLSVAVVEQLRLVLARAGDGRIAVIVPNPLVTDVGLAVTSALGDSAGRGSNGLDAQIAVLTVGEAKGLEFDEVIVVEPAGWASLGLRGLRDLYVALTRATQQVTLVHSQALPAVIIAGLAAVTMGPVADTDDDDGLARGSVA